MSTIHGYGHDSRLAKVIHRIFHEIEERTDTNVDKVAEVIEMWEQLKTERMVDDAG